MTATGNEAVSLAQLKAATSGGGGGVIAGWTKTPTPNVGANIEFGNGWFITGAWNANVLFMFITTPDFLGLEITTTQTTFTTPQFIVGNKEKNVKDRGNFMFLNYSGNAATNGFNVVSSYGAWEKDALQVSATLNAYAIPMICFTTV